jgi:Methyl-accepting chemotaxis protein (MCP) signalling domain
VSTGHSVGGSARLATIAITGAVVVLALGVAGYETTAWVAGGVLLLGLGVAPILRSRPPAPSPAVEEAPAVVPAPTYAAIPEPSTIMAASVATNVRPVTTAPALAERVSGVADRALVDGTDHLDQVRRGLDQVNGEVADVASRLDHIRAATFQVLGQNDELRVVADQIADTVEVIRKVAAQTNLLSLNATIEAARAGDAGRSFSVVAGEVRKLAQDSRSAAESINSILLDVRDMTEATGEVIDTASQAVEDSRARLRAVGCGVADVVGEVGQVRTSVELARAAINDAVTASTTE